MGGDKETKEDTTKSLKSQPGLQTMDSIVVREFESADKSEVHRIFSEGVMEMISDTAFRGLIHHPESVLLYTSLTSR